MQKQVSYKIVSLAFAILVSCFAIGFYAFAVWQEPTANPPGDNVPPPINASGNEQMKSGALRIGGVFRTDTATYLGVSSGNVGIGTMNPKKKLEVSGSDVYINQISGKLIMKSPDGSCSSCGPSNSDLWSCASVACP